MKHTRNLSLTLRQRRDMFNALQALKGQTFATRFAHAAARNRSRLASHMEALQEAGKPVAGYQDAYEQLAKEMARRDPAGNPLEHPHGGWLVDDKFNFNRRVAELKTELGQDLIEAEIEELLDVEETVKISMVEAKFLPTTLTLGVAYALLPMIDPLASDPAPLELTKGELDDMWSSLQLIMTVQQPAQFVYALARNRELLLPHMEPIMDARTPAEGFDAARVALARELARKDQLGQPLLTPEGRDYVVTDRAAFERRLDEIKQQTGQDKKEAQLKALFSEKLTLDLYTISEADLPSAISAAALEGLLPIITESDEELENES